MSDRSDLLIREANAGVDSLSAESLEYVQKAYCLLQKMGCDFPTSEEVRALIIRLMPKVNSEVGDARLKPVVMGILAAVGTGLGMLYKVAVVKERM